MIAACIIGWPVAHSRSPLIHGYWLKKYAVSGRYVRRAVPPEGAVLQQIRLADERVLRDAVRQRKVKAALPREVLPEI